jgi:hypothetical protein
MNASNRNTENLALVSWTWISANELSANPIDADCSMLSSVPTQSRFDLFRPIRRWLDDIQINNPEVAHRICQLIPAQCPFERTIKLFGYTLFHIPPLCKLNPVYDQVVALRFRALCYLADVCGEDISAYC